MTTESRSEYESRVTQAIRDLVRAWEVGADGMPSVDDIIYEAASSIPIEVRYPDWTRYLVTDELERHGSPEELSRVIVRELFGR